MNRQVAHILGKDEVGRSIRLVSSTNPVVKQQGYFLRFKHFYTIPFYGLPHKVSPWLSFFRSFPADGI